uniref:Cilia- and flagella-associated protein 58 central coiled coil domain-containing protein n=1 Tax=Glossina brevipalpis TaxID=37001 RepID=A0A1A9WYN0_9MUSC
MPPKAAAKGGAKPGAKGGEKKKKKKEPEGDGLPPLQDSETSLQEREFDLLQDLNEEFFGKASKLIQNLMERGRIFEASKIKKYSDLLFKVHRRYSEEVRKVEELQPLIGQAEEKLRLALELTANSEETMQILKETLGDAWRESDASLYREEEIQEKLQEVLLKCESFESKEAEKQDDSAEFGHLAKYKNIILRERDRINGEVIDLEKRLQMQRYYSESLEYIIRNNEDTLTKTSATVKVLESEKQNLENKIRALMYNAEEQKEMNAKLVHKVEQLNRELGDLNLKFTKKTADYDRIKVIVEKFRGDNTLQLKTISKNEEEISELHKEVKNSDEAIKALRLEDKAKAHTITQLNNKYKKAQQDHKLRRLKDNVTRERDNLRSDIVKLNNQIADLKHTIVIQSNNIDNLHLDINKLNVKLDEAKVNVSKAEKERGEMAQEMETLHEKIEYFQEQIQLKSNQVTDLSEKLQQKHFALINMKKQLEAVHSEKMILQRNLETCTQERDNFRTLQTKTSHQITQLTNEISANQNKINSLNLRIERLNNEKKDLQSELKNKENLLSSARKDLKEMKIKNENLLKTISDDELKFMKLSQELDETRKEKNLIGLQMVRRNDEIILLKEKLQITQTALDQGQTQYNQRVEDIRILKMELTNLQTERECLSRAIKSTADMREEIIRLQRALNQERVRVRSLTEDAKTPTAVHRWRILKGEDPNKFQLLAKVQMLQRRNLKLEIEKVNVQQQLEESRQLRKLKALKSELFINKIEMKARECIIEEFKATLKLAKKDICEMDIPPSMESLKPPSEPSADGFVDCAFVKEVEPEDIVQDMN